MDIAKPLLATVAVKMFRFCCRLGLLSFKNALRPKEGKSLSSVYCRSLMNNYYSPFMHKNNAGYKRYTFLNRNFLLGGILSFLGLEKEKEEEDELIILIKRSILLREANEMDKSEQMLHLALKMAQETHNEDGITYVYDLLANLAYERQDFAKAEKLFVSVMQRLLAAGTAKDDNKIIHISLKLAGMYSNIGLREQAEEGFKYCISKQQNKIDSGDSDTDTLGLWAMGLDWYSRFLLDGKRYKEAQSCLEKAYKMSEKINGMQHEQTMVLLNDLGTVCSLRGDYDSALNYLQKAVELGGIIETEDLPSFYVNIGSVYMQKGLYAEAKRSCEQGWKYAKRYKNKDAEKEAGDCLSELGKIKS